MFGLTLLVASAARSTLGDDGRRGTRTGGWGEGAVSFPDVPRRAGRPWRQDPMYYPWSELANDAGTAPPELLLRDLRDLQSAGKYEGALLAAEELVRVAPEHPVPHYNLACTLAHFRRSDEAFAALVRAVDLGWRNLAHTRLDLDLQPLRQDPRFQKLLERLQQLRAAERLTPGPLRDEPWPRIAEELETQAPRLLQRYRVPGAAVALLRDGQVVWTAGFGIRHVERQQAMTASARFPLGASNRLLTLGALLQEHRGGRLELAQVVAVLDEPGFSPRRGAPLTVGLPASRIQRYSRQQLGGGDPYAMMQMLVEVASRRSFADYWRCGVEGVGPMLAEAEEDTSVTGHSLFGTPFPSMPVDERATTAEELARIIRPIVSAVGTGSDTPAAAAMLEHLARLDRRGAIDLGLAVHLVPTPVGPQLRIDEERRGLGCVVRCYPDSEVGVVVLYNGENGAEAARRIAHLVLGGWE